MKKSKKIIYSLIILILLELFVGIKIYKEKNSTFSSQSQKKLIVSKKIDGPSFSFSPLQDSLKVNEVKELKIVINSKGKFLTGADAVIKFDPNVIEIVDNPQPGEIFPFYPILKVKPEIGEITITGTITDPNQPHFQGEGIFATIFVKPLKTGETSLKFKFSPGRTDDSNLAEKTTGKDILVKVNDISLSIKP